MIKYERLFELLYKRKIKKTELLKFISHNSMTKLNKNESVTIETINKICNFLQCQPADIMEYYNEDGTKPYAEDTIEGFTTKGYEKINEIPESEIIKMKNAADKKDTKQLNELMMKAIMQASGLKEFIENQMNDNIDKE